MKKLGLILVAAALLIVAVPALADNQAFEASVLQTGDLGAGTVYQKYWTAGKPDINANCGPPAGTCGASGASCQTDSLGQLVCPLTYSAKNAGGYRGYSENLFNFGDTASGTTFNSTFEYQTGAGSATHTGYYAWVTGPVNAGETSTWNATSLDCAGSGGSACFGVGTSNNSKDYTGTPQGTITKKGGLSPIPAPRAFDIDGDGNAYTKGGVKGTFQLKWDAVTSVGKAAGASPTGYDLYFAKTAGACGAQPAETAFTFLKTVAQAQAEVGFAEVGMTSATDPSCVTFALKIRYGAAASNVVISRFLSANGQSFGPGSAATVYDIAAKYIGRTNVEVSWKTSLEDGVQAFNVLRSTSQNGAFQKIGTVPAKGTASSYSFIDTLTAPAGPVAVSGLFYKIESIDIDNSATAYGPVKATLPVQERPITVQKPAVKKHR